MCPEDTAELGLVLTLHEAGAVPLSPDDSGGSGRPGIHQSPPDSRRGHWDSSPSELVPVLWFPIPRAAAVGPAT